MFKFLSVTALSALVLFIWGAITLVALLPLHNRVLLAVRNESGMLEMLQKEAPEGGVYSIPIDHAGYTATSPFAVIAYRPGGFGMSPGAVMGVSFLTYWLTSIVAALLLSKTSIASYAQRVFFVLGLGLFASLVVHAQNWIWTGYSVGYTLMAFFDVMVGWLLAGVVLARFIRPQKAEL